MRRLHERGHLPIDHACCRCCGAGTEGEVMAVMVRLYRLSSGRLVVPFFISQREIDAGFNGCKPGVYFLRGAWYGNDLGNRSTYGKTEGMKKHWGKEAKFVGLVSRLKSIPQL